MILILCIIIVRLSVYDELTIERVCCSTICTSTETYCPFCGGLIYTANQNISCHKWFKLLHKKQVILEEKREAGAQRIKGGEPDKGVRRERLGDGSSKMAGSRRNYLAILNFCGIKKGVKGGSHKKGWRPQKQSMMGGGRFRHPASPPHPPHTHTHWCKKAWCWWMSLKYSRLLDTNKI